MRAIAQATSRLDGTEDRLRRAAAAAANLVQDRSAWIVEQASAIPVLVRDLGAEKPVRDPACTQGDRVGGSPVSVELRPVLKTTRIVRRNQPPLAEEHLDAYAGRWVALRHGRVVDAAPTLMDLRASPKVRRGDEVRAVPPRASASIY